MNAKVYEIAKIFDHNCPGWERNKLYNEMFVRCALNYCRELCRARGYLFLNEVYEKLGMPLTRQGQMAGWIFNDEHKNDHMWTVLNYNDDYDVYITFEPLSDILDTLPNEEEL